MLEQVYSKCKLAVAMCIIYIVTFGEYMNDEPVDGWLCNASLYIMHIVTCQNMIMSIITREQQIVM